MAMILKHVAPSRGAHWVRDGLRLYLKRPLAFTGLFVLFLFAALMVSLVPRIGLILQMMLLPMLSLGLMVASQSALLDGRVHPAQFIEPLRTSRERARALLLLCALYGIAVVSALYLVDLASGDALTRLAELMRKPDRTPAEVEAALAGRSVAAAALGLTFLVTALTVPFWHAPALVHWAGQGAWQALFSSAVAVWRSRGAFLVYGLTWFAMAAAFSVVSGMVFGLLGLGQLASEVAIAAGLFFSTLFYVSLIFSFNDSFGSQAGTLTSP